MEGRGNFFLINSGIILTKLSSGRTERPHDRERTDRQVDLTRDIPSNLES